MSRCRDLADSWLLARAAHVFKRRGWGDAPGRPPVVGTTAAHLAYRARALRAEATRPVSRR